MAKKIYVICAWDGGMSERVVAAYESKQEALKHAQAAYQWAEDNFNKTTRTKNNPYDVNCLSSHCQDYDCSIATTTLKKGFRYATKKLPRKKRQTP